VTLDIGDKIGKPGNQDKRVQNIEQGISNFENEERIGIDDGDLFDYKWQPQSRRLWGW